MTREELVPIVEAALKKHGGKASLVEVARYIWEHHEANLKASGDLFYTWQYDMRWAATKLRRLNKIVDANISDRGIWQLV